MITDDFERGIEQSHAIEGLTPHENRMLAEGISQKKGEFVQTIGMLEKHSLVALVAQIIAVDDLDLRMLGKGRGHCAQNMGRKEIIIRAQQDDDIALAGQDTLVEGIKNACVRLADDVGDMGSVLLNDGPGVVGGFAIDDDDLDIRVVLLDDAIESLRQGGRGVVSGNDDGDLHIVIRLIMRKVVRWRLRRQSQVEGCGEVKRLSTSAK